MGAPFWDKCGVIYRPVKFLDILGKTVRRRARDDVAKFSHKKLLACSKVARTRTRIL